MSLDRANTDQTKPAQCIVICKYFLAYKSQTIVVLEHRTNYKISPFFEGNDIYAALYRMSTFVRSTVENIFESVIPYKMVSKNQVADSFLHAAKPQLQVKQSKRTLIYLQPSSPLVFPSGYQG